VRRAGGGGPDRAKLCRRTTYLSRGHEVGVPVGEPLVGTSEPVKNSRIPKFHYITFPPRYGSRTGEAAMS
jgi:hypothetical protein